MRTVLQDVGDGLLLEDPALVIPREQPELGDHLGAIAGQGAAPLGRGDLRSPWLNRLTIPLK